MASDHTPTTNDETTASFNLAQRVLIWIERVLLVSGMALVVAYSAARIDSRLASRAALDQFAADETLTQPGSDSILENLVSNGGVAPPGQIELPNVDFSSWGDRRIQAYQRSAGTQSGSPLAVLHIARIGLEAPLFDGTDNLTLNHGLGRIAGTSRPGEPGNIGIAGHRDGFLRRLKDVSVGDAIELKTLKGTASFVVDQIQIVSPHQVEVLRPTPVPSLTLVTCYPFYFFGSAPQRYIVTASLSQEKRRG